MVGVKFTSHPSLGGSRSILPDLPADVNWG
jgi:hypothetical protein